MNILYVVTTLPVGGAEEHLRTVVKNLDRGAFRPTVCCIGKKGAIGEEIESLGVEVIVLDKMRHKRWDSSITKEIVGIIRERDIDIVHTHLYHANMYGRAAASKAGVPVVVTEHNVYLKYKLKRKLINRFLARNTARIIAVSGAVREYVIGRDSLDPDKVEVVYNGIELDRFDSSLTKNEARSETGLPENIPIIGSVARLTEQKGHIYLIRAMKGILQKIPEAKLVLAGDGPLAKELKDEADSLGITQSILFLGARRDVPMLLQAFDLYVLPSVWEGLGIAVIEAMASALPVVVSNTGGLTELVSDGDNGRLVEPKDVEGLSSAIVEILGDAEMKRLYGSRSHALANEKFSVEAMVSTLTKIYTDVVAARL